MRQVHSRTRLSNARSHVYEHSYSTSGPVPCAPYASLADAALAHAPGSAGAFSVAIVNSSPFPCLCPVVLTCCCYGWWRTVGSLAAPRAPSQAALWADTPPGTSAEEAAKRRCAAMCRHVFSAGSSGGWSGTASSPCFFPPCFPRRFRSCRLRLPAERWASRAGASLSCSARRAPCGTLSSRGLRRSSDADRPHVVWKPPEVVGSPAVLVHGPAGGWRLLRDMEDARHAQDRCRGKPCVE